MFDGYEASADLAIVLPHRSFLKDPERWFKICGELTAHHIGYRLLLAGDEIVDHPLTAEQLGGSLPLLIPQRDGLLSDDRQLLAQILPEKRVFSNLEEALAQVRPAVRAHTSGSVRVLPRVRPGSAVVHVLNFQYDPPSDGVRPLTDVQLTLNLDALGVPDVRRCQFVSVESDTYRSLPLQQNQVRLPQLGLWGLLILDSVSPE